HPPPPVVAVIVIAIPTLLIVGLSRWECRCPAWIFQASTALPEALVPAAHAIRPQENRGDPLLPGKVSAVPGTALAVTTTIGASRKQEGIMSVISKSSVLAAIFLGTFAASARAEEIITVNIPFAFVVEHHEFSAGRYDIRTSDDSPDVVWIEGMTRRSAAVVFTVPVDGRDPAGAQ